MTFPRFRRVIRTSLFALLPFGLLASALAQGDRKALPATPIADADASLNSLLQRDPIAAPANLAMARVLVQEGHLDDAAFYYHRAIYGQWKQDAQVNQIKVRFELADLLNRENSRETLLAELLPLQNEAPDDAATRIRLGNLFLAAGSPARAAEVFRAILRRHPRDEEARAGLDRSKQMLEAAK